MSLRTRGAVVSALSGCLLLAPALASCSDTGPVAVDTPSVSDADRATCAAFLDDLPHTLAGQERRDVTPSDALGAAWGDPAITLTCGVSLPADFDRFATCEEADGVGWFVPVAESSDQSSDVTLTAAGYRPIVRVQLPASYRPEGAATVISQLAQPVKDGLELVDRCH
ncbi:MAG TPA: DUF3515 domain-containing protein [Nocardioides sp.]|nr:DUF3515 domain-containing protein [Nocardioides sp.]